MDLERKFHQEVHFALIPTQNSWEAPAHLMFGGWKECPLPEEHVAMFKYWAEKWGAEVFAIAGDVVEMRVSKPPTTDEAATGLAREQFVYCSDIVHQGTETVRALGREIKGADGWFFWWD